MRRSPRLQRTLSIIPQPEKKKYPLDKKSKRGRPSRSKLREMSSTLPTSALEVQIPLGERPAETDEEKETQNKKEDVRDDKTKTEESEGVKALEEKVTPATESKGPFQFQHPKYEGCMWIKGSLIPPYSGNRRWKSLDDAEIEPLFDKFEMQICEWASEYAVESGEMIDNSLSDQDKQVVMDTLGSYCAFRDWDGLIEGLSPKKDTPVVSISNTPHIPIPSSPDIKQESPLDSQSEGLLDIPSASAADTPADITPEVKLNNAADEPKKSDQNEPMENASEAQIENHADDQPNDTSNAPLERPSEDMTPNSPDAPPPNADTIPPSSSPEVLIENSPSSPPQNASKNKPTPSYLPTLLVECLLSKCLYENVVQNPFYYLIKAEDEAINSVPTTFGKDFYNIWQKLMRASRVKAHRVRMEITQLLNGFDLWDQCHDISIGAQSRTLRKQAAEHLVALLVDPSSPLHPLLRPLHDPKQIATRSKRLMHIFREAAEIAVWMYTQESYFLFVDDVASLGPFDGQITGREECLELGYKEVEDTMKPYRVTRGEYPDGVLNGRSPVLMTRPVVRRVFVDSWTSCALNDRPGKVVSRAVVLLGREEPLDEDRTKW